MKKYTVTFLFSLLSFLLCISYSIETFSQESEDAQQQFEDNTSLQQEEDDTPAALDEIIDNNETQPQGSSYSPAVTKDNSAATKDSENDVPDEPTVRISKIKIKRAKVVTKQQIEEIIGTEFPSIKFWVKKPPFDEEVLKDDMIRIQRLYANNGYYDTKATYDTKYNKDETRVEIKITIEEGEPVILTDIDLKIEGDLSDKIKKQINKSVPLVVDKTFSPNGYQQTKGVISEILSNNGYPKSDIEGEALVNRREKWARAKFVVKPGLIYKFGVIKVEGNEDVASRIVEREAEFKEGEIFSLSKINETQANIFQLGLFRSVVIDPVYNEEEQIADIAIVMPLKK